MCQKNSAREAEEQAEAAVAQRPQVEAVAAEAAGEAAEADRKRYKLSRPKEAVNNNLNRSKYL